MEVCIWSNIYLKIVRKGQIIFQKKVFLREGGGHNACQGTALKSNDLFIKL